MHVSIPEGSIVPHASSVWEDELEAGWVTQRDTIQSQVESNELGCDF